MFIRVKSGQRVKAMSQSGAIRSQRPGSQAVLFVQIQEFTVKLQKLPGMRCSWVNRAVESSVDVFVGSKMDNLYDGI